MNHFIQQMMNFQWCLEKKKKLHIRLIQYNSSEAGRANQECNFALVGENCQVKIHRCLIRSVSPVIDTMCKENPELENFHCPMFTQSTLDAFVSYLYTSTLTLSKNTFCELYHLSSVLNVPFVRKSCMEYLCQALTIYYVGPLLEFAYKHNFQEIRTFCLRYCVEHFEKLVDSEEYLNLSVEDFVEIVLNPDLHVCQEEALLDAIIQWVNQDPDQRMAHAERLSATVRYQLIDVQRLVEDLESPNLHFAHEHIKIALIDLGVLAQDRARERWERQVGDTSSVDATEPISDRDTHVDSTTPDLPVQTSESQNTHRDVSCCQSSVAARHQTETQPDSSPLVSTNVSRAILAILGGRADSKKALRDILCFELEVKPTDEDDVLTSSYQSSSTLLTMKPAHTYPLKQMPSPRRGFGAALFCNQLFVIGGKPSESMQAVHVYDVDLGEWMCGPPMLQPRTWLGVAQTQYSIFAIGGCNLKGQPLNHVEFMDIRTGTWTSIPPMPKPRMSLAATAQENCIYAIGGFNKASCDKFDMVAGKWMEIAPLETLHEACGAVTHRNIPHVMGGAGPVGTLTCFERYNAIENIWEALEQMPQPRAFPATSQFGDNILVIGGRNDQNACRDVQIYNTLSQRWSLLPNMLPSERASCCAVRIDLHS